MINNLFSIFDPSTSYISFSWLIIGLSTILVANSMNSSGTNNSVTMNTLINNIGNELSSLTVENNNSGTNNFMESIFIAVITLNIVAIFPFNFTTTAHISVSIAISLTVWAATIINGVANSANNILIHLTPIGTPGILINFIVIIELISSLIRPITLSVRLTANIVAGHLLLSLLGNFSLDTINNSIISFFPIIILLLLELAVSVIQAYVITILLTLYYNETL